MVKKLQKKKTREIIARERTREKTLKIQICSSASSVVVLLCIALFVLEAITALAEMGATAKDIILLFPQVQINPGKKEKLVYNLK